MLLTLAPELIIEAYLDMNASSRLTSKPKNLPKTRTLLAGPKKKKTDLDKKP